MYNEISSQVVTRQFGKAVELFLVWLENRIKPNLQPEHIDEIPEPEIRLLTAEEAAEVLNISKSSMYQIMQRKEIPCVHLGRSVRIRPSDLDNFINDNLG